MIYKTYLSKFNTIIKDSKINTGLNPVSEIVRGHDSIVSRALIWFDHNKVKKLIDDGIMPNMDKMKHTLHIHNSGAIDQTENHGCGFSSVSENYKLRSVSFDLIFFLIPKPWDRGKGFHYTKTYLNNEFYTATPIDPKRLVSEDACNWYQPMNGYKWDEEGIYSNNTLSAEYDKWACREKSVIIGRQHFDYGNENIEFDITDVFNKFITGELENYGIGIAYTPMLELKEEKHENYIGLLTDKTNLFFEPYVETRYYDYISDDRANFILDKDNRLYLYCNIGDNMDSLDSIPKVTVRNNNDEIIKDYNGTLIENVEATQYSKGVYYIDLKLSRNDFKADTMLYDTWDGLVYHGTNLEAVELDFTTKSPSNFFKIGDSLEVNNETFVPSIVGIKELEDIKRGDIRGLTIIARPSYTFNKYSLIDEMYIRLYIKDGTREIDVIEWDKVDKCLVNNYYTIDTNILIPQRYYIDVRIKYGMNNIVHHNVLSFNIVDDIKNKYV